MKFLRASFPKHFIYPFLGAIKTKWNLFFHAICFSFQISIYFKMFMSKNGRSMILLFYYLPLQQNYSLVTSFCMQLHLREERDMHVFFLSKVFWVGVLHSVVLFFFFLHWRASFWPPSMVYIFSQHYTYITNYSSSWYRPSVGSFHILHQHLSFWHEGTPSR